MDTKTLHLHEEIIEEILPRLPVKSLLRFRCVSKSLRCLIGSNRFIKTHLKNSKAIPNYARWQVIFIFNSENTNTRLKRCSYRSLQDDPSVNPLPFDDPFSNHLSTDSRIVGHSNGLVCIFKEPASLFLWNPATRISIELPKPDIEYEIIKLGFGWDDQSDAYKVFVVLDKNESDMIGNIYSSKTNSWKIIEQHGSVDLRDEFGNFGGGRIYWLVRDGYIETFDLKSEVFGRIELPCKQTIVDRLWLSTKFGYGGGCSVLYDDCDKAMVKVWGMKKDGEKESWVEVGGGPTPSANESIFMVFAIEEGVVKFYPRENIVDYDQTCRYIDSLVPPVSDNNA